MKAEPKNHYGLLAVIMLAVLVAAVAVAWLLSADRQAYVRRGAELIAKVRADGLEKYWPAEGYSHWFKLSSNGQEIGWMFEAVVPAGNGRFHGLKVHAQPHPSMQGMLISYEYWDIDRQATNCHYLAESSISVEATFQNGRVLVTQRAGRGQYVSSIAVPENYLPEGTMDLAAYLVAKTNTPSAFKNVGNEILPDRDVTRLASATMKPKPPVKAPGVAYTTSLQIGGYGQEFTIVKSFDQRGRLVSEEGKGWRVDRVNLSQLAQAKLAAEYVLVRANDLQFPMPPRLLAGTE